MNAARCILSLFSAIQLSTFETILGDHYQYNRKGDQGGKGRSTSTS
jgi:hypothetical protein